MLRWKYEKLWKDNVVRLVDNEGSNVRYIRFVWRRLSIMKNFSGAKKNWIHNHKVKKEVNSRYLICNPYLYLMSILFFIYKPI